MSEAAIFETLEREIGRGSTAKPSRFVPVDTVLEFRDQLLSDYKDRARTRTSPRADDDLYSDGFVLLHEQDGLDCSELAVMTDGELEDRMWNGARDIYLGALATRPLVKFGYERLTLSFMTYDMDEERHFINQRMVNRFTWKTGKPQAYQTKHHIIAGQLMGDKPELSFDAADPSALFDLDTESQRVVLRLEPDDIDVLRQTVDDIFSGVVDAPGTPGRYGLFLRSWNKK